MNQQQQQQQLLMLLLLLVVSDDTFVGKTPSLSLSLSWYNNTITKTVRNAE